MYNADGSLRRELQYLLGRMRGTAHCALSLTAESDGDTSSTRRVRPSTRRSSSVTVTSSTRSRPPSILQRADVHEVVHGEFLGCASRITRYDEASRAELAELFAEATADDLDESGIEHIHSPSFVSREADGQIVAASGYRQWPNAVAHLSVLTHPAHRQRGHGRRASHQALLHAIDDGLLPQWRARPMESQELARTLGLVAVGAQLSLEHE